MHSHWTDHNSDVWSVPRKEKYLSGAGLKLQVGNQRKSRRHSCRGMWGFALVFPVMSKNACSFVFLFSFSSLWIDIILSFLAGGVGMW